MFYSKKACRCTRKPHCAKKCSEGFRLHPHFICKCVTHAEIETLSNDWKNGAKQGQSLEVKATSCEAKCFGPWRMRRMWWGCECVLDPEKCAKANAKCVGEMAWNSNRCKCEQKSFVSRLKPGFVWKNSKYVLTEVE